MPAPSLTAEPRFREPDPDEAWQLHRAEVQAALVLLWGAVAECNGHIDKLDRWAGRHERVADAGEAREDAAEDIATIAALLVAAEQSLENVLARALAVPA